MGTRWAGIPRNTARKGVVRPHLVVEAEMSLNMRLRDELRGTEAGRDPWAGVRLMRLYEEREFRRGEDEEPSVPEAAGDDGRPG